MMATTLRLGQLGAGFIGQMHSLAFGEVHRLRREPVVKAELVAPSDLEALLVSIEARPGTDANAVAAEVRQSVKETFGLTPEIAMLETGTLAKEFESSVKTPRFIDRRR